MTSNDDDGGAATAELLTATIELGGALRELIEASVTTTAAATEVAAAAELVRAATARIGGAPRPVSQLARLDDPAGGLRVFNPVTGVAHPLAPPLVVHQEDDGGVVAEVTLGLAYEGPPTFVHGGMSALFMDQMLGSAAGAAGLWGMTAHLELDYRSPLPLQTALQFRARVASHEGRKAFITGTIALAAAPEKILVEARGLFVMPRPEKQAAYFGSVTDAAGRHAPPRRPGDATALQQG